MPCMNAGQWEAAVRAGMGNPGRDAHKVWQERRKHMQYQLSEKERQILEHEVVYQDRKVGVIGGYCESGFPIYYANQEIALMLGYTDVDDLEKGIHGMVSNTIHPEDQPQVMKDLNGGAFFEGMTYETTYRMPRKDGTWFWTVDKGKVIKTDDGRLAIISLCSDMTAFVRRKKELEKEHLISESMLSNLPGGYHRCAMEAGFPFLYISDRFLDVCGWTREEIAEKFDNKFANMVHPDDRELVTGYVDKIISPVQKNNYTDQIYRIQGKNGYQWITDSTLSVDIDGKKVLQGSISNVTKFIEEREKKEEELKNALKFANEQKEKADEYAEKLKRAAEKENKRLEEEKNRAVSANEMKSRFLSSVSHDIRTPINGIQGMLRIADEYPHDMKKQSECREKMWIATQQLVSLVNNVLDLNRLENNAIDLKEEPFNLIELLMSLVTMTRMQTDAKGLHCVVDWKPGYIEHRYLIGSSEGLFRILMNLNSNAIKYNKKDGTIYCRCMEKERDGDTIWFEFVNQDTGIGMDEEFLKYAFEPYAQKNNPSLSSINGVGLGLSIVQKTVEIMGGNLKVESKVGEGTRYTIRLPFKLDPSPQKERKPLENVKLDGVKALLVEDNELNIEIATFLLEQQQMQVVQAMNGKEAVDIFEQSEIGSFDIILMDVRMPVMDGLEATRQIRSLDRPDASAVPIIAMSANAFKEDIEETLEAGMNAYLVKPLDNQKVIDTIKNYLADKICK